MAPTILVVEDNEGVRRFLRTVLEDDGFNVVEAPDGVEALDVADRFPGVIDVLLADVIMPRMGGGEVAATLVLRRPGLKAVYMSGHTPDTIERYGGRPTDGPFLTKPSPLHEVLKTVRGVLPGGPR